MKFYQKHTYENYKSFNNDFDIADNNNFQRNQVKKTLKK